MTWKPNIVTRQAIEGFISDLFATAPEIMGIDEAIAGCEVILMDPYATGALPRYIRVRIREYYQDVTWRGNPSLVVGDFCTVLHFRDGNRYEVIGASGAGGIDLADPYLYVWVYDVDEGILVPYDTINGALGYGLLAADDFVLIPPGTFDETITLVNGVFICEQIPGTVTLHYTGAPNALSGTVVVADGGYLNIRNIYRAVDGDCNAVFAGAAFSAECIIIVENIEADGAPDGNMIRGVRMHYSPGTLHLYAKNITALSPAVGGWTGYAVQCWYSNGTLNLYAEQGYGTGPTSGYGISCGGSVANLGFTINVYGGVWEGAGPTGTGIYCTNEGVVTVLHATAVGSVQDLYITGTGIINIFQVQYGTTTGTPTHLPGDHIVLDLDGDTYVSALLADDRIDFFVAGANPTNIRILANNVVSLVDNLAQAFSIADVGGFGYMHIETTNAQPITTFNIGEEDIDFRVCALGITGAIFVEGLTGAITVEGPSLTVPAAWNVIVPDNIADAFGIDDAGGLEYMRIASTNANPYVLFDPAAAGINVGIAGIPGSNVMLHITGSFDAGLLDAWGVHCSTSLTPGNGTIAYAFGANPSINVPVAETSDLVGLGVHDMGKAGAGTCANMYAVYVRAMSGAATNKWGVYITPTVDNYFAGNVGIGIVVPLFKFDLLENRAGNYVARFVNDGDNVDRYGILIQGGADNGAAVGTTYYLRASDGDGTVTGYLQTVNGVFGLVDASDVGRKANIVDTKLNGLDIIKGLRVRDYNWKANPKGPLMVGFVAQEALEAYPDMVSEAEDGTLMSCQTALIPILAKAVQEIDTRLTQGGL